MFEAPSPDNVVTLDNATVRSAIRVAVGGHAIRIRLANEFGPPLRVGAITVRTPDGVFHPVTFGQQSAFTLPDRAPLISDPVSAPVRALDVLEVSIYLPDHGELKTIHIASGQPSEVSAGGDHSAQGFVAERTHKSRPLIAGIDVLDTVAHPVIVAFGDSITDNTGCANDAVPVCRWSDVLARRIAAAGMLHSVVNQAISGNRVLDHGTGPSALARFDRDVISLPGVTHIVILEGINDIGNSGRERDGKKAPKITANQLIEGYRQLIARAHDHGIKVIGMTILPFEGARYQTESGEALRANVNRWIRESGAFDGVVDLESSLADRANPRRLATELQSGDNLHPNGAGQTVIGEAIPLSLFR